MAFIYNKIMKLGTVGLIAAGVLAGCASTESKMAVPYIVELNADSQVNPNASGKPSPVKVTVYELKSTNAFDTADYFALMKDPRAVLGDQMLEVNSRIIKPGSTEEIKASGSTQAKALGIVASYRDLNNSQWRLVVDLPEAETTNFYKFWQFSPDEKRIRIDVQRAAVNVNKTEPK
ncbi:type VI secretion system protein VasD [Advenella incenata]|jgi:type VI secretion system protein VasD|uniref:Type VI secretion system protein VasD n=1 Tax=Advenella incenata TaxID=267800 RepID=A0A4Q7VRD4_9BURK|nr:type VI secretion system lipoprotein TssJ [Advenella incenata]RZT99071.1 type VI secretion system protein VasD [Advenella incenata]